MKRILLLLPFLFIPLLFSGPNFSFTNNYIDSSKREIINDLKLRKYDFEISDKLWVVVDSSSKWTLSDNYYSYLFYFDNNDKLSTTFDLKTSKCVSYVWDYSNFDNYYDLIDCFNDYFIKTENELKWKDDNVMFVLYPNGNIKNGFTLYIYELLLH
jgi:hypothetical protein